jgi:hypothetical protein
MARSYRVVIVITVGDELADDAAIADEVRSWLDYLGATVHDVVVKEHRPVVGGGLASKIRRSRRLRDGREAVGPRRGPSRLRLPAGRASCSSAPPRK